MVNGIRIKVCGVTRRADARFAADLGADYLGFNFYPKSPRYLPLAEYAGIADGLKGPRNVAVIVEPTAADLATFNAAGFDFFQIHFRHDVPASTVAMWAETVGPERLWLAPKLPPATDLPVTLQALARTVLLDTFDAEKFGGTGKAGDWVKFARHQQAYPGTSWILSGGLNPGNIADAVTKSGARFVDVNSGVESAPGQKDPAKLRALVATLRSIGT